MRSITTGLALALWSLAGLAMAEERLVLEPYPATPPWREATHKTSGATFLIEQIPADESIDSYRDILSAQSFPANRANDPSDFLRGLFSRVGAACESVRVNGPKAQVEAGYAVAYGQAYCGRQRGKPYGVRMFYKVLQGQDALYVVLRESRVPPSAVGGVQSFSQDQMAAAVAMMKAMSVANDYIVKSVYLCGGASTEPRCAS